MAGLCKKLHKCLQYGLKCYHCCLGNKSFSPGKTTAAKNWLLCNSWGEKRVKEGEEKKKNHSASPHGPWSIYPDQMLGGKDVLVLPAAQQRIVLFAVG